MFLCNIDVTCVFTAHRRTRCTSASQSCVKRANGRPAGCPSCRSRFGPSLTGTTCWRRCSGWLQTLPRRGDGRWPPPRRLGSLLRNRDKKELNQGLNSPKDVTVEEYAIIYAVLRSLADLFFYAKVLLILNVFVNVLPISVFSWCAHVPVTMTSSGRQRSG